MVVNDYKVSLNDELEVFVHLYKIHSSDEINDSLPEYTIRDNKLVIYFNNRNLDKLIFKELTKEAINVLNNRFEIYVNEFNKNIKKETINDDIVVYSCYKKN
jgi:hypothetical protein